MGEPSRDDLGRKLKNLVIGERRNPFDRHIFHKLSLIAFFAWIGLGVDGLSSACYGPQEAFLALGHHIHLGIFVGLATIVTIFVIVADHCARTHAKSDSSPVKFHIPAIIYAPKIIPPQRIDAICSQIDLIPTLLGLMNVSYETKFFGRDVLREPADRAFIGTELDVGMILGHHKVVVSPGRIARAFNLEPDGSETPIPCDPDELERAISYYQGAGLLLKEHLYDAK